MKIKPGASIQGLHLSMRKALLVAEDLYQKYGLELVVTGGLDGEHSAGSFHYYGFAVDLRTQDPSTGRQWFKDPRAVAKELQAALGPDYYVLFEGNHFHIHYRRAYEVTGVQRFGWT